MKLPSKFWMQCRCRNRCNGQASWRRSHWNCEIKGTKMKIGDKLNGRIAGIQPYGALLSETGVTGLIHISSFGQDLWKYLQFKNRWWSQVQVVDFWRIYRKGSLSIRTWKKKHQLPRRRRFRMTASSMVCTAWLNQCLFGLEEALEHLKKNSNW